MKPSRRITITASVLLVSCLAGSVLLLRSIDRQRTGINATLDYQVSNNASVFAHGVFATYQRSLEDQVLRFRVPTGLERDVEIDADQNSLAAQVPQVGDGFLGHDRLQVIHHGGAEDTEKAKRF